MVVGEADNEMSLSNMVLGFYEDAERERRPEEDAAADGSDEEGSSSSRVFWQEQHSRLHVSCFPPSDVPFFAAFELIMRTLSRACT
jgi:hypothetical protein